MPELRTNLTINPQRLWDQLMETAQFGGTAKGGIKRLTLTDEDKQVRDWFKAQCEAWLRSPSTRRQHVRPPIGRHDDLPPIAMGSHLDTQPTGGKFDGVLGVLGALEALRTMVETGYETNARSRWSTGPTRRVALRAGDGSVGHLCRRVHARVHLCLPGPRGQAVRRRADPDRLPRRGSRGPYKLGAWFELHIEQGPILEAEGKVIGVVQGVQGMRWYEVTVTGQDAHTGSTPMHLRKNALQGAARMIERIDRIALDHAPGWARSAWSRSANSAMSFPVRCSSRSTSATPRKGPWTSWKPSFAPLSRSVDPLATRVRRSGFAPRSSSTRT